MNREVEKFIGPCSKHVAGEGWVTEVPLEQIYAKGYTRERATTWEEWYDDNLKPIWICGECKRTYQKVAWRTPYKYCPNCGAKIVAYKSLDYKE